MVESNNSATGTRKSMSWESKLLLWVVIAGLLAIGIFCLIASIRPHPQADSGAATISTQTPPTLSPEYKLGDAAKVGAFTVTVNSSESATELKTEITPAKTDNQFVIVTLSIASNADAPRDISRNMFKLVDSNGRTYEAYDASAKMNGTEALFYETVNPGLSRTRYLAFETPKGTVPAALNVDDGVALAKKETVKISLTK